jgi:Ni/Fe-hydrogenase subunit HybB-like protein
MPVAITAFLAAGLSILVDQGRPLMAMDHLLRSARPGSPMFYTFTLLGAVCLYGNLVHCILARRADLAAYAQIPSFWQPLQKALAFGYRGTLSERLRRATCARAMSIGMLFPLTGILVAIATIFVVRPARPWLPTSLELASFFVLALSGGLGLLAGAAWLVIRLGAPGSGPSEAGFGRLGRALLLCSALSLFFVVAKTLVSVLSSEPAVHRHGLALVTGDYAFLFWTEVGGFFLGTIGLALLLWRQAWTPGKVVLLGLVLQIAVFTDRFLALVGWQTHGHSLPFLPGHYLPTRNEIAVALGILALALLLLLPAVRLIPFAPLAYEPVLPAGSNLVRDWRRRIITGMWMGMGVILLVVGFLSSARVGTLPSQDPILPGSPILVIVGLMTIVTTGAIYEWLPDRRKG